MKSVYTGGEKVAEFESYDELRVGDGKPAFIYEGNELVYPNPIKDGLVLWYDFSGRTNADGQRGIAEDLSGNGNHGTLKNFNFTPESGYDKNRLLSDGTDDTVRTTTNETLNIVGDLTVEIIIECKETTNDWRWFVGNSQNASHFTGFSLYQQPRTPHGLAFGYRGTILKDGNYTVEEGKKYHLIGTSEGGLLKFYINGQLITSRQAIAESENSFRDLSFMRATYYASPHFKGGMGSTRIYNKALTPEEVQHNYAIEKERFGIE